MENDTEAKRLALDFIPRCRSEGRTIDAIANTAGWILQIRARNRSTQKWRCTGTRFARSGLTASSDRLPKDVRQSPRLGLIQRQTFLTFEVCCGLTIPPDASLRGQSCS